MRDTQSVPQGGTHREVHRVTWRRGRKEIEATRTRRGGVKRKETDLASNHFPLLSTVWTPQRCSRSYTEKRRGRKGTEMARRRKGGIKRRETDLASNLFPVFSTAQNTQRDSQSWVEKRRGREKIEVTWGRKRRVKKGRGQSSRQSHS